MSLHKSPTMNHPAPNPHRSRPTQRRLVQASVVACGLVAGLVELFALQRRRMAVRHRARLSGR